MVAPPPIPTSPIYDFNDDEGRDNVIDTRNKNTNGRNNITRVVEVEDGSDNRSNYEESNHPQLDKDTPRIMTMSATNKKVLSRLMEPRKSPIKIL